MLALFTRNRTETPMPKTATPAETDTDVVMRFLTQGGATVTVAKDDGRYPVLCLGCDYRLGNWSSVVYARTDANDHAASCRAMPKPTA